MRSSSETFGGFEQSAAGGPHAFTLPETLATLAVVAVVASLMLSAISRSNAQARQLNCQVHLRQVHVGFRLFTIHNNRCLPDTRKSNMSWERSIEPYLEQSRVVFGCPADNELFPATGSSYDWRDTGDPLTTLAGARLADVERTSAVFAFDALPGWHLPDRMNVVCVNGSVVSMAQCEGLADLLVAVRRK